MSKAVRLVLGLLCLAGLLFVRFRESELFYDPLINYFHGDFQNTNLPELSMFKLIGNLLLRYGINMLFSLGLLWAIFLDKNILKFVIIFYLGIGILLLIPFYILLKDYVPSEYLAFFYVRRFLIQPLIVFLLIPAFFYYRKVNGQ